MNMKKGLIILAHSFVGWVLCAAVMGIGLSTIGKETTQIIHLILAPVFFISISIIYFKKFNFTSPIQTAVIFVLFIIGMDFFLVALIIMRSMEMFTSIIGTWLPFLLIFLSTWFTGMMIKKK